MKEPKARDKSTEGQSAEYLQSLQMQIYLRSIECAIDIVHDQPQKLFRPVADPDILSSIDRGFQIGYGPLREEARPADTTRVKFSYFLATNGVDRDLLQHTWVWKGLKLRIVENFSALQLDIPLHNNALKEKMNAAKRMFEELVRTEGKDILGREYQVTMQWPDSLSVGASFTSNPEESCYGGAVWQDRVDAYVQKNVLSVIFYKINPLRARMYGYGDNKDWLHHRFEGLTARNIANPSSRKKSAGD